MVSLKFSIKIFSFYLGDYLRSLPHPVTFYHKHRLIYHEYNIVIMVSFQVVSITYMQRKKELLI